MGIKQKTKTMSRRKGEPVGHTCPDIDRIISTITQIVNEMGRYDADDVLPDLLDQISGWRGDLIDIGFGNRCSMEDLRSANDSLRRWGSDLYDEAEQMESEIDTLRDRVDELEDSVSALNKEIDTLAERAQ